MISGFLPRRKLLIGAALLATTLASIPAQAQVNQSRKNSAGIEPWAGRRVLLLMPLQLGEGFNADRAFGQAILPRAEYLLQQRLQATGKFSVVQSHRFSPLVQRGLQEKRLTEEQITSYVTTPTLESARALLSQFTFDRPPMIADFRLEEVRAGGDAARPSVQAQVSGRLYELNSEAGVALKSPVVTSDPVRTGRNNIERYLGAADLAFAAAAAELVAPLEDIQLPRPEPEPAPAPVTGVTPPTTVTPTPAPAPVAPAGTVVLPGDTPIAGSSTRGSATNIAPELPAARPPLGITVPNTPAVR